MVAEYKRALNHNYLVLHGEKEIDTASYQVRMLIANTIPCLLPCRLQSFDGEPLFYYDITSRQSVAVFYEKQKLMAEDLEMLFGGIVRAIEQIAAFLLNPDQLFLEPEYLYMDVEKKELYLCCLPGYNKEVREQFRSLTEYFLPKINHQDNRAVNLGYGVYRRAMEPEFQMEQVMEELYGGGQVLIQADNGNVFYKDVASEKERQSTHDPLKREEMFSGNKEEIQTQKGEGTKWEEESGEERGSGKEKSIRKGREHSSRDRGIRKDRQKGRKAGEQSSKEKEEKSGMSAVQKGMAAGMLAGAAMLTGVAAARGMGYFSGMNGSVLIGGMLILGTLGIFVGFTWKRWENRGKEPVMPIIGDKEGIYSKGSIHSEGSPERNRSLERSINSEASVSLERGANPEGNMSLSRSLNLDGGISSSRNLNSEQSISSSRNLNSEASVSSSRNVNSAGGISSSGNVNSAGGISLSGNVNSAGGISSSRNANSEGSISSSRNMNLTGSMGLSRNLNSDGDIGLTRNMNLSGHISSDEMGAAGQFDNQQAIPVIVGETEELTENPVKGAASLVSKGLGIPSIISLEEELTVIGKLPTASDAVLSLPTVSRIHAKIRRQGEDYYLTDLNSRNGTCVNGKMLKGEEEYCLCDQDEISFGEAQYMFVR